MCPEPSRPSARARPAARAPGLGAVAQRAPYLSSLLIIAVGIYVGRNGWLGLRAG